MESGSRRGGGWALPSMGGRSRSRQPGAAMVKSSGRDKQKETGRGLTRTLLTGSGEGWAGKHR